MAQSPIALRTSAARQVEAIHAAPCSGLFPLTPALSLGERVNLSLRGEQSRLLGFPLRDARCSLSLRERGETARIASQSDHSRYYPAAEREISPIANRGLQREARLRYSRLVTL